MTTDETPQAIFERIQRYPSILKELKDYQLEMAVDYARGRIGDIEQELYKALEPYVALSGAKEMREQRRKPFDDRINDLEAKINKIQGEVAKRALKKSRQKLERLNDKMEAQPIIWTKGTDRPLQDVLSERWEKKLQESADELALAELENEILGWKETIQNYEQSLSIHNYHHQQRIDMRLHIRKLRELVKRLGSLLDEQEGKSTEGRERFHTENYWDTANKLYRSGKGTWEDVYNQIINEMDRLGIERRHSNFESFESARKQFQRNQIPSKRE